MKKSAYALCSQKMAALAGVASFKLPFTRDIIAGRRPWMNQEMDIGNG